MKKYNKRNFSGLWFYVALLATILLIYSVLSYRPGIKQILYSDLLEYIKSEQVSEMVINEREVIIALKDENTVGDENKRIANIPSIGILYENAGDEIQEQLDNGSLKLDTPAPEKVSWWISILPSALSFGLLLVFFFFIMRQTQGGGKAMSFGKSTAKMTQGNETHVTFKDVAGADEEKAELEEIVDFLRDSSKFIELGARIPKGVLLVGPPGTGKTLLAKAVAGEANVPFFTISGSDFVEMFVGVGASRVRDLFDQAKKAAPSIIFIDEIDAVGRHRGAGLGGGHDEREQTLNQLLVEMDGFGANEGIIIIAATNRPDILDPALLRPGRFDRQIVVNTPDVKGREEILKVHSRAKPLSSDVDLSVLAKTTAGFTGADLENLMNEAALLTARKGEKKISMKNIEDSVIKVIAGPEKRSSVVSEKEKKLVSYHEAGHAIIHHVLPHCDPVHEVSIVPRGRAGGYTLSLPKEDKNYISKEDMLENIVSLLGGRVAEQLVLNDISTGASNDIERATKIARDMVMKYGMSDQLGPISFRSENDEVFLGMSYSHSRDYSEEVAAEIDSEVRKIIDTSYQRCTDILNKNMAQLHNIAGVLFEREKIDADEFIALFNMQSLNSENQEESDNTSKEDN